MPIAFHFALRALVERLVFVAEIEGLRLLDALSSEFPEMVAACLMPDHLHLLLPHDDPSNRLQRLLAAHAQAMNRRRGCTGPLWQPRSAPEAIPDALHLRRTIRYIHLNPCRARIASDPIEWSLSTHRDRCGLAARPVVPMDRDPAGFHGYVSGDPTVHVAGTPLPSRSFGELSLAQVAAGTASVWRVPIEACSSRHPARQAFVRAAWHLGLRDARALACAAGLERARVYELVRDVPGLGARIDDPILAACTRAAGDLRFEPIGTADLRSTDPRWARYRRRW